MTDQSARPYAAFRLNLEQQQKRAKDLLKAAKAGNPVALRRLREAGLTQNDHLKLTGAQHCVARELRLKSWGDLRRHALAMEQSRAALGGEVLDGGCRTMHIRCGHDIERALRQAGFHGDFNAHTNPYLQGPVTDAVDWLERRACFIADALGPYLGLDYASVLDGGRKEEARLAAASRDYERVVLWFEHDRYDQFALLRCLASFAERGAPPRLELVAVNDFPGAARFVGLGQLPPEALRLLWDRRAPVAPEQIAYGQCVWNAFRAPDPRRLAELALKGTPQLPDLAVALHRHLRELPSPRTGLGQTHELLLAALADHGPQRAGRLVGRVMHEYDALPGLGDIGYDQVLREMADAATPLVQRSGGHAQSAWHADEVALTPAGHAVLRGARDWLDLVRRERWIGGVRVAPGQRNWRFDERTRRALPGSA